MTQDDGAPHIPLFHKMTVGQCQGAAVFVVYLLELFTRSGKDTFTQTEVVNIIDMVGQMELPSSIYERVKGVHQENGGGEDKR